jgi:antitoxin ParD1/3/4
MATMNISLPDALRSFVDEQTAKRGYSTGDEYVCELIRADQDRQKLRNMLLDGAASAPEGVADEAYFVGLRKCGAVPMISEDQAMETTLHLLGNPANAKILREGAAEFDAGKGLPREVMPIKLRQRREKGRY